MRAKNFRLNFGGSLFLPWSRCRHAVSKHIITASSWTKRWY